MALVTTKELMLDAQKNHYAIGAFNAENMEMVQAIIAAAEELRAPRYRPDHSGYSEVRFSGYVPCHGRSCRFRGYCSCCDAP